MGLDKLLNQLKEQDFSYTGSSCTEKEAIANGHIQLTGEELFSSISNKTVFGDYPMGFQFVADIYENGITKGVNNIGTIDSGSWSMDFEKNTLKLVWKYAWIDTQTRAYEVNGNIEFYDVDTGNWRTTFKFIETLEKE